MSKEMRELIDNFRNFLTENSKKKLNISDVSDSQKYWFNDREKWDIERNKLNVSDDDINWSKDDKGKLISFWYEERNEGWIKK